MIEGIPEVIQADRSHLAQPVRGRYALLYLCLGGLFILWRGSPLLAQLHLPPWCSALMGAFWLLCGLLLAAWGWLGALRSSRRPEGTWQADYPWDPQGRCAELPGDLIAQQLLPVPLLLAPLLALHGCWWSRLLAEEVSALLLIPGDLFLLWFLLPLLFRLGQHGLKRGNRLRFTSCPWAPGEPMRLFFRPNRYGPLVAELCYVEEWFDTRQVRGRQIQRRLWLLHYRQRCRCMAAPASEEVEILCELPAEPSWVNQLGGDPRRIRYWLLRLGPQPPGRGLVAEFLLPVYGRPSALAEVPPSPIGARPGGVNRGGE